MSRDASGTRDALVWPTLLASTLVVVGMITAARWASDTLRHVTFPSGWVTFAILAWLVGVWWRAHRGVDALRSRLARHVIVGVVFTVAFAIHIDWRVPTGVIDGVITVLAAGFCVSLVRGAVLLTRDVDAEVSVTNWLRVHTALGASLVALSALHAGIAHSHGLMAHLLFGAS